MTWGDTIHTGPLKKSTKKLILYHEELIKKANKLINVNIGTSLIKIHNIIVIIHKHRNGEEDEEEENKKINKNQTCHHCRLLLF